MTETLLSLCAIVGVFFLWDIHREVTAIRARLEGEREDEYEADGS